MNIYYTCLFVLNRKELIEKFKPKYKNVVAHHSTVKYKPQNLENIVPGFEMGKILKVKVLAICHDEFADALLIENPWSEKKHTHITLSHTDVVDRNYANKMIEKCMAENSVLYLQEDFYIEMRMGWVDEEKVEYF